MEALFLYLIFAITTAIVALLDFFWPIIQSIRLTEPDTMVAENWKTALFSLTLGALLVAPILLAIIIVPKYNQSFRYHLEESLTNNNKY